MRELYKRINQIIVNKDNTEYGEELNKYLKKLKSNCKGCVKKHLAKEIRILDNKID